MAVEREPLKNALYCTSLNINVKIEADVEKLKET